MNARTRLLIIAATVCHLLLFPFLLTSQTQPVAQQTMRTGSVQAGEPITIQAQQQEKIGDLYRLRGDVEVEFRNYRLQADEMTYNDTTGEVTATGHVVFDGGPHDQHLIASHGTYNVDTDEGRFYDVVGTTGAKLRGKNVILTSSNPFSFSGAYVDKLGRDKIIVHHGTVTSCALPRPKWSFHANEVSVIAGEDAKIYNSTFWLWRFPLFYFPFIEHPVEHLGRKTGLLIPTYGQSSVKGTILGDAFFWAINRSMNASLGAEFYSKRGWAQHGDFEARPSETSYVAAHYFGVLDRGVGTTLTVPGPNGTVITLPGQQDQGGQEVRIIGSGYLHSGVRAVGDIDYLSSFIFREAFSETFTAINSEVRSTAFVTDNWHGYSFNTMVSRYQNFQSVNRGDLITIVHAPSLEASSVDRRLGQSPLYWSFDAAAEGLSRREPDFVTANVVGRFDLHPDLSLPVIWHGWSLRPEVAVRDTWYSDRLLSTGTIGTPGGAPVNRRSLETSFEVRPPSVGRIFERPLFGRELKHTIEPLVSYNYTTGVENFPSILRFDWRDILSDTNEIQYGVVNRLFSKRVSKDCTATPNVADETPGAAATTAAACSAHEVISWELMQKYFFDPMFGGALVPGRRNVFTTTEQLTGIAFLTEPRRFSPIVSRLRIRGPATDIEWQLDYDTLRARINASTTLVNYHFLGDFNVGAGHFYLQTPGEIVSTATAVPAILPTPTQFNQFRVLASYGHPNRRGFSVASTFGYDAGLGSVQYSAVQSSYNWDCCGITFEYRRFNLGIRDENQFRFALSLANIGTFGTLRKQERLY